MIEHPNKQQRSELEKQKRDLAQAEFEASLAEHEARIDKLLARHLESPVGPHIDYQISDHKPGIGSELQRKYTCGGWCVEIIHATQVSGTYTLFGGSGLVTMPTQLRFY